MVVKLTILGHHFQRYIVEYTDTSARTFYFFNLKTVKDKSDQEEKNYGTVHEFPCPYSMGGGLCQPSL